MAPKAVHHGAVAQLGERLNGIQEVDGSTPFSSILLPSRAVPRVRGPHLWRAWRTACVLVALLWVLAALGGCAAHQRGSPPQDDSLEAQPLGDDDTLADKAGEVGVVGLVLGVMVGGILLPLFLL